MDRERKLLYVVAVLAPIFEVMTLFAWHQMSRDVTAAGAAHPAALLRAGPVAHSGDPDPADHRSRAPRAAGALRLK